MHFFAIAAVLHTLVIAVLAFFVLFAASKADGFVRLLGNVLGWILLIAAVLGLAVGIVHVVSGKPMMDDGQRWMMHFDRGQPPMMQRPATPEQPKKP